MRRYIKCLPTDFGLENGWAALDSVEGRSVSVGQGARREPISWVDGRAEDAVH
jgi:hypothetical protein